MTNWGIWLGKRDCSRMLIPSPFAFSDRDIPRITRRPQRVTSPIHSQPQKRAAPSASWQGQQGPHLDDSRASRWGTRWGMKARVGCHSWESAFEIWTGSQGRSAQQHLSVLACDWSTWGRSTWQHALQMSFQSKQVP